MDRTSWGPGPWDGEPDKAYWIDEATGFPCLAVRPMPSIGSWCGYVAVPPGHPLHGKDYSTIPDIDVHGGLTFSSFCQEDGPVESRVCHTPEPGQPANVWWLGWDCAHASDVSPGLNALLQTLTWLTEQPVSDGLMAYRTLDYVRGECTRLGAQLKALEAHAGDAPATHPTQ
jgi:hypothetical protein